MKVKIMEDNSLKFIFVGILLISVLLGRVDQDQPVNNNVQENIQDTSLTATVRPNLSKAMPTGRQAALTNPLPISNEPPIRLEQNLIYRTNWDLPDPILNLKAAIAKDLNSNFYFYNLNSDERWPLASLTKLLAAVTALEKIGKDKAVTVSEQAIASEGPAGNFSAGENYSVNDLIKAMVVVSSNDAAAAIAEFYGNENFVAAMQLKATALGMRQSNFSEATGISFLNQGTAADLEKLINYILANHPEILAFTKEKEAVITELKSGVSRKLVNINNFADRPDFSGGKTGFTDQANGNLISIFNHHGHKILIIVLGTDDRFGQTELLYNWIKSVYNL